MMLLSPWSQLRVVSSASPSTLPPMFKCVPLHHREGCCRKSWRSADQQLNCTECKLKWNRIRECIWCFCVCFVLLVADLHVCIGACMDLTIHAKPSSCYRCAHQHTAHVDLQCRVSPKCPGTCVYTGRYIMYSTSMFHWAHLPVI